MIQQVPWIERKFHFDFPVGLFPVIYSRLEGTVFRIQQLVENAEENTDDEANGWTIKEHIGHLTDLESLWWMRLEDFKSGKPVLTAADMANEKTRTANHNEKSYDQLFSDFQAERYKMLETIYWFNETFLSSTSLHPRLNQPMRVVDSLYFVAEHDDHHIAKMQELL